MKVWNPAGEKGHQTTKHTCEPKDVLLRKMQLVVTSRPQNTKDCFVRVGCDKKHKRLLLWSASPVLHWLRRLLLVLWSPSKQNHATGLMCTMAFVWLLPKSHQTSQHWLRKYSLTLKVRLPGLFRWVYDSEMKMKYRAICVANFNNSLNHFVYCPVMLKY